MTSGKLLNGISKPGARIKDLTGRKFGKLTAIAFAGTSDCRAAYWYCRCECGNEKAIQYSALVTGNTRSCGCSRRKRAGKMGSDRLIDIAGQRFGTLTAIALAKSDRNGNSRWLCRCDCGNERIVYSYSLRSGKRRSCGRFECVPDPIDTDSPFSKAAFFDFLDEMQDDRSPAWFLSASRVLRGIESDDLRSLKLDGNPIDVRKTREAIEFFVARRSDEQLSTQKDER